MSALDRELRRELGRAVRKARKTAEAGARAALGALTVGDAEADASLTDSALDLRRRLRAHGRQLGDERTGKKQKVTRLAREVAYEHWHRMLFARFLAENDLLIEPENEVPVSLEDCRELARGQKKDPWALASEFAAAMLPQIFRPDDPSLEVSLPPETRRALEKTLDALPPPVFRADDSLGWTYQYWQTDRKKALTSDTKIGADELPAVTQLFTEPYMVRFLFHNTVGAWRAGRLLAERPDFAENAENEDELRRAVRLEAEGGYDFDFLRFVREEGEAGNDASGRWRPSAGSYEKWPTRAADLRVLDPCCGSGHFLVEGLHLFVRLRMEDENLPAEDAIRAVLKDNLHGLEIDPRCAQIAAFAVAFAAWKLAGRFFELPSPRIACSGLSPNATKAEWIGLAEQAARAAGAAPRKTLYRTQDTLPSGALRQTFGTLHDLFAEGPMLGSLIDPHEVDASIFSMNFDAVRPLLDAVLEQTEAGPERRENAVAAAGMAEAASLLVGTYSLVITNVPYLSRQRQVESLSAALETRYPDAKNDLATAFAKRALVWLDELGVEALVMPQNWLFLGAYKGLRRALLDSRRWRLVARLGENAFEDPSAAGAFAAMTVISAEPPEPNRRMCGMDVSAQRNEPPIVAAEKAELLRTSGTVHSVAQKALQNYPDAVIRLRLSDENTPLLENRCGGLNGTTTGDYARFGRTHWEFSDVDASWVLQQSTVVATRHFAGREHLVHCGVGGSLQESAGATIRGKGIWGKQGVAVSQIGDLDATLYTGEHFDNNVSALGPLDGAELAAVWCFCASPEYARSVREIDQKLNVTNATLAKVPFDFDRWKAVAAEKYPNGLPEPYSDDPTQWIFHGHPCGSAIWDEERKRTADGLRRTDDTVLQVAVARLLGYRWPAERDAEMRLADEQRAWVERCTDLHEFADEDEIVCLPAVRGEASAADRLRTLLAAAYGGEWTDATERRLLHAIGGGGGQASTTGCAAISSRRTAVSSTIARSSGTSGTGSRTASTRWSTTTGWPARMERAVAHLSP